MTQEDNEISTREADMKKTKIIPTGWALRPGLALAGTGAALAKARRLIPL